MMDIYTLLETNNKAPEHWMIGETWGGFFTGHLLIWTPENDQK